MAASRVAAERRRYVTATSSQEAFEEAVYLQGFLLLSPSESSQQLLQQAFSLLMKKKS